MNNTPTAARFAEAVSAQADRPLRRGRPAWGRPWRRSSLLRWLWFCRPCRWSSLWPRGGQSMAAVVVYAPRRCGGRRVCTCWSCHDGRHGTWRAPPGFTGTTTSVFQRRHEDLLGRYLEQKSRMAAWAWYHRASWVAMLGDSPSSSNVVLAAWREVAVATAYAAHTWALLWGCGVSSPRCRWPAGGTAWCGSVWHLPCVRVPWRLLTRTACPGQWWWWEDSRTSRSKRGGHCLSPDVGHRHCYWPPGEAINHGETVALVVHLRRDDDVQVKVLEVIPQVKRAESGSVMSATLARWQGSQQRAQ